jgi:hypothetical protein
MGRYNALKDKQAFMLLCKSLGVTDEFRDADA